MRTVTVLSIVALAALAGCQADTSDKGSAGGTPTPMAVAAMNIEVGCASCIYEMPGIKGCKLAGKIDGVPRLITGTELSAHKAGLCSSAKQAKVKGKVEGDDFVASEIELE